VSLWNRFADGALLLSRTGQGWDAFGVRMASGFGQQLIKEQIECGRLITKTHAIAAANFTASGRGHATQSCSSPAAGTTAADSGNSAQDPQRRPSR